MVEARIEFEFSIGLIITNGLENFYINLDIILKVNKRGNFGEIFVRLAQLGRPLTRHNTVWHINKVHPSSRFALG